MNLKISNAFFKQQFVVIWNNKNLNANNILKESEELGNFNAEMESKDVDTITDRLLNKLNKVINNLALSKRVQVKKKTKCEKAKKLYKE